jgi:hypothetical protein
MILFGGLSAVVGDAGTFEKVKSLFQYPFATIASLVGISFGYFFRGRV